MYGNNIQATGAERVNVQLIDQSDPAAAFVIPGKRYFFPENPFLEKKNIVGIECHLKGFPFLGAAADTTIDGLTEIGNAPDFFITLYDKKGFVKFENIPLSSLLPFQPASIVQPYSKKVNPYMGKLDFSKSYIYIAPNNIATPLISTVALTFFYQ
jgi:hypothetical protein